MTSDNSSNVESVHILRGVAAILVLLQHSFKGGYLKEIGLSVNWPIDYGQIGVCMFFVISGFIMPYSLGRVYKLQYFGKFLLKRILRIEPTYILSIFISVAWVWIATRIAHNAIPWEFDWRRFFAHIFYLVPITGQDWFNAAYWTLAVEFQFYLLLGLTFEMLRKCADKSLLSGIIIIIMFSCFTFIPNEQIKLFYYSPFFAMGTLNWLVVAYRASSRIWLPVILLVAGIGIAGKIQIYSILFSLLTFFLIYYWKPSLHWYRNFGTISYSLYVTHLPIILFEHKVGEYISRVYQGKFLILLPFLSILASIALAHLIYIFCEKPSQRLSKMIKY